MTFYANEVDNISLATIIAKVFGDWLHSQLGCRVWRYCNQFYFRPGLSNAVLCLNSKRGTDTYAYLVDLSKTFNLVSYDIFSSEINNYLRFKIFQVWHRNQVSEIYRLEYWVH